MFSSRVNDGIRDCCDGRDEYNSEVKCPNTCWETGKMTRDKLKKKLATYQEGVTLRKREVEQAKLSIAKDEAELSKLKSVEKIMKGLVQQLKERKDLIEKAEEEQRLQREKEKAKTEDAEIKDRGKFNERDDGVEEHLTDNSHDKIGISEDTPLDQEVEEDCVDTDAEVELVDDYKSEGHSSDMTEKEDDEIGSNEALSKEELGRLVAFRWTGENTGAQTEVDNAAKHHDHEDHQETPKDEQDDDHDGYASDSDDDNQKYDNEVEDPREGLARSILKIIMMILVHTRLHLTMNLTFRA